MKRISKQFGVLVLSVFYVFAFLSYGSEEIVTANNDELLRLCEKGDNKFVKMEIGEQIVYFHQRMIGDALVEKDFTVYQFSKHTKELIKKIENKRKDLPEKIRTVLTAEDAAALVTGEILQTQLIIISPQSDVFPIKPNPENPCWVVKHEKDGEIILTVIDAVDKKILSEGISPPGNSIAYSGPCYANPCRNSWSKWYISAYTWFTRLGYFSVHMNWPRKTNIQAYVQQPQTMLIYQFGHGSSSSFANSCINGVSYEQVSSGEVRSWMMSSPPKFFVFLGHCDGMYNTGYGSFSYEYRKGGSLGTTTTGYCGMGLNQCNNCWLNSLAWQNKMFNYIYTGYSVRQAFYQATADFPMCNSCVKFAGDPNLVLKIGRVLENDETKKEGD